MAPKKKRYKTGALPRLPADYLSWETDQTSLTAEAPQLLDEEPPVPAAPSASASLAALLAGPNNKDDNTKQSAVAKRKDAPISAPTRRFDKSMALTAAEDDDTKTQALLELEREIKVFIHCVYTVTV